MIVRILGEGQFDVPDTELDSLNPLDQRLTEAVEAQDEAGFESALAELLEAVRSKGRPHEIDSLDPSDLMLPAEGSSLDEVQALLGEEGLIPG